MELNWCPKQTEWSCHSITKNCKKFQNTPSSMVSVPLSAATSGLSCREIHISCLLHKQMVDVFFAGIFRNEASVQAREQRREVSERNFEDDEDCELRSERRRQNQEKCAREDSARQVPSLQTLKTATVVPSLTYSRRQLGPIRPSTRSTLLMLSRPELPC